MSGNGQEGFGDEIWFALNQGNASTLRLYNPPGKL
jgi:hypothetical protein